MTLDAFAKIVAIAGTALGILGSVYAAWKYLGARRKAREQVKVLQAVGDRFVETANIEGEGYEQAIEHYRKALELDAGNVGLHRRLIRATRCKLALEPEARLLGAGCADEIEAATKRLYELQTSQPQLKDDLELMLEEAELMRLGAKSDRARAVLEKACVIHPNDPEPRARLGLLLRRTELVRSSVEARPENADYRYMLGEVLEKTGEYSAAIREYRRAAELATGEDIWSRRNYHGAKRDLLDVFKRFPDGLDMPLEERAQALEFGLEGRKVGDWGASFELAKVYHALGRLDEANRAVRDALGEKGAWPYRLPMVKLLVSILEQGGFDAATLAEARALLQEREERSHYDQVLEAGKEKGPMLMLGLRTEKPSGDGVRVLRTFDGYSFAKAGVREGDRIVELAHRKVRSLNDIRLLVIEFVPGTDLPMKVERGGELVDLTLVVQ